MANNDGFAKELNELITRYISKGTDPEEIVNELIREANLVFGRHNLEIYLVAQKMN